jgi:hypothetical protein
MRNLLIVSLLALLSCQPETRPATVQYSVPASVEPYIQSFRAAAQQRNRTVSTDRLIVEFGDPQGEDVFGRCRLEAGQPPHIVLSMDAYCWQLGRLHRNDHFTNRTYVSLMNPDNTGVYATCRYPTGDDECDKRPRRTYYLDELFEPATPKPSWAD